MSAIGEIQYARDHHNGRVTFTIERARGETYASDNWAVYAHDSYERHSVLHGRSRRRFLCEFATQLEAVDACKAAGVWRKTEVIGGTTYVPIDQIVSHLPDDTDY